MSGDVTSILNAIEQGDARAADELLPAVYQELRRLAAQKLSQEKPGQTLQGTALVHEAYIRLVGTENPNWKSQGHFFGAAAEAMRRILIENARRKQRIKHGGASQKVDLEDADMVFEPISDDLIALDEALTKLATKYPIKADLVKLRYFTGLNIEETVRFLNISPTTAKHYWAYARARLFREISKSE